MAKNVDEMVSKAIELAPFAEGETFGQIALTKGDSLTFTGEVTEVKAPNITAGKWAALVTKEGYNIGFRQITRRGNGLIFPETVKTPIEAIKVFITAAASAEDGLKLTLANVRKVESSTRDTKNTYYIFEEKKF